MVDAFINDLDLLAEARARILLILCMKQMISSLVADLGGLFLCRRHLNIRGKSANLPAITDKDWLDLKFGIDVGVDYYALSFVRNADVIYELKRYLSHQGKQL